jgi:hypothetical protein
MKTKGLLFALVCIAAVLSSCWENSGGPGTPETPDNPDTTSHHPSDSGFAAANVVFRRVTASYDQVILQLTNLPGLCGDYGEFYAASPRPDFDVITLVLIPESGQVKEGAVNLISPDVNTPVPHTFTMGRAYYEGRRKCTVTYRSYAQGTVNITHIDSVHITGDYHLTFDRQWPFGDTAMKGSMDGAFDAPYCPTPGDPMPAVICKDYTPAH